jgi:hypothetical protein
VVVATERFAGLAREEAGAQGLADARIAVVPHPIGGAPRAALLESADAAVDEIVALFGGRGR